MSGYTVTKADYKTVDESFSQGFPRWVKGGHAGDGDISGNTGIPHVLPPTTPPIDEPPHLSFTQGLTNETYSPSW